MLTSIIITAIILVTPVNLYANSGTSLIWVFGIHSFFISMFLVFFESFMIYRLKITKNAYKIIVIMLIANILSAQIGLSLRAILFDFYRTHFHGNEGSLTSMTTAFIFDFFISIIIEYSFIYFLIKKTKTLLGTLSTTLKIHVASYFLMIVLYVLFVLYDKTGFNFWS